MIHTDNFFLVPHSMQLIMSQSEQNIPCDICSQFTYQIAYLGTEPGSFTFLSKCSANIPCWQHLTAFVSSSLYSWLSRCRLSCTEALHHPWMISFTPLTRKSTKSLNKDKMRHFLAKRKWKVKHGLCPFSYRCSVVTFQSIVQTPSPVISLSSGVIYPFKLLENR